jgi:hypothetical protein
MAALWASCTWRWTAEAYYYAVETVGSGIADVVADGGEVPNISRYGAHPILRAYVVFTVNYTSRKTVRNAEEGRVTRQRLVRSWMVRCKRST